MICGYRWKAPYVLPPESSSLHAKPRVTSMPQVCVLDKNHEGDHRSITNVTAPNKKES